MQLEPCRKPRIAFFEIVFFSDSNTNKNQEYVIGPLLHDTGDMFIDLIKYFNQNYLKYFIFLFDVSAVDF